MTLWAFIFLVLFFGAFYFWMAREQSKERTVLRKSQHPDLGEIRHYRSCWEANITEPAWGHSVLVWGDDPETVPSETSLESLRHIKANYAELLPKCIEAMNDLSRGLGITLTAQTVRLESIALFSEAAGKFELSFELPSARDKFPNDISVIFENFELTDLSDNH